MHAHSPLANRYLLALAALNMTTSLITIAAAGKKPARWPSARADGR